MSGRGSIDGLAPRYSLRQGLPAVFHTDRFITGIVDGFDQVLAPVHATLDDLDAYLDPATCPPDFLVWLGSWLGVEVSERWPARRRRELVARAVEVYRLQGTARGIRDAVELYTGSLPVVTDSGAVSASAEPLGDIPGRPGAEVTVTIAASDGDVSLDVVERIVDAVKPAHVRSRVEFGR